METPGLSPLEREGFLHTLYRLEILTGDFSHRIEIGREILGEWQTHRAETPRGKASVLFGEAGFVQFGTFAHLERIVDPYTPHFDHVLTPTGPEIQYIASPICPGTPVNDGAQVVLANYLALPFVEGGPTDLGEALFIMVNRSRLEEIGRYLKQGFS